MSQEPKKRPLSQMQGLPAVNQAGRQQKGHHIRKPTLTEIFNRASKGVQLKPKKRISAQEKLTMLKKKLSTNIPTLEMGNTGHVRGSHDSKRDRVVGHEIKRIEAAMKMSKAARQTFNKAATDTSLTRKFNRSSKLGM